MTRIDWRWWLAAFVLACTLVNPYVRGDGQGYYAWLVSAVVDRDLDFTNQFERADPLFRTLMFEEDGRVADRARTPTGRVGNQWSVGPAVLWAPWFVAAHAAVSLARLAGATVPADGYSWPYLWTVAIGTVTYGLLTLLIATRLASALGYGRTAGLAALAFALASSLPVYMVFLPFHVHALAAFTVALFVTYACRPGGVTSVREWAWWGALAGLMVQVYQLNGVLLIAAIGVWIGQARTAPPSAALARGCAFAAAGILVCAPQLAGKAIVYGSPWTTGYQDQFFWSSPRLWETLWSANHGWWSWTPIALVACLGCLRLWRHPGVRPLLVSAGVFYLVVASYQNWHGQSSFGNRFFLSWTVLLVVGLAAGLEAAERRVSRRALALGLGALAIWNAGFIFQWGTNIIPNRGPVSFRQVAVNQAAVPGRLWSFLWAYLGDRRGTQQAIERDDVRERDGHVVVR